MSARLVKAIYDHLAADTGVGGFCNTSTGIGTRLYHVSGPENLNSFPACVYLMSPHPVAYEFRTVGAFEEWSIVFSIWVNAETSSDSAAMAHDDALWTRLHGQSLSATGYDRLQVIRTTPGSCAVDEDGIRVDSEWLARATRSS